MKNLKIALSHLFSQNGKNFIFVTNTQSLYELDEDAYAVLKAIHDTEDKLVPPDAFDEETEEELLACHVLVDADDIREDRRRIPEDFVPQIRVGNVLLQIANDCNLNCIYCYGSGGSYGRKREMMSWDTAKKAIDYMVEHCADQERLLVTFFGGEPLMNFPLIKQIIAYCDEIRAKTGKKFSYSMTTNGTIMNDEILDYIKRYRISTMISMDGPKSIQDSYRCYENGCGSFDKIVPNIEKLKKVRGGHLTVRSTVCRPDMDMCKIRRELLALGFTNVVMSPVDTDPDSPLFVGGEYSKDLIESYRKLADELVEEAKKTGRIDNILFSKAVESIYNRTQKIRSCTAGRSGFAVGSNGLIYPCQRFMGMEEYAVGDVDSGIDPEKIKVYFHATVVEKESCPDCWAKYLCGAGCVHTAVSQTGDPMKAPLDYCETYRTIYEIGLYIYSELKAFDDSFFYKLFKKEEEAPIC